jgi:hypothetical protein
LKPADVISAWLSSTLIPAIAVILVLLSCTNLRGEGGLEFVIAMPAPQDAAPQSGMVIVRCIVRNTADSSKDGFLVARFVDALTAEDRRHIQVDPHQSRIFEFPVRIPPGNTQKKIEFEIEIAAGDVQEETAGTDVKTRQVRPITVNKSLLKQSMVTAVALGTDPIPGLSWRWGNTPIFHPMQLALASRVEAELSNKVIDFGNRPLPLNSTDWLGIDVLILADPRHLEEQATVTALRTYLAGGGRVWIMLDAIDCSLVEGLLPTNRSIRHVDTIGLHRFVVDVHGSGLSAEDRSAVFDHAIPFKQIVHTGGEVTHSIDGWPAALVMPIGKGELILTMLSSEAWMEPRQVPIYPPENNSQYQLRPWAKKMVDEVFLQRTPAVLNMSELDYPLKRIGNPVVSRGLVTAVLLSFCASLAVLGLWRFFAGKMPQLGLWIPALSFTACVPILVAGLLQKKDIPDTVSLFQWVQFSNPSGGSLRESAAVYLQSPTAMVLSLRGNGFAMIEPAMQSGITTVTHNDFENWQMSNSSWPSGVWRYTTETQLPEPSMIAHGRWTPKGLEVQIPWNLRSKLSDPIVHLVPGAPALGRSIDDKTILIDGQYPAEGERWTLQTIVDEEQSRRVQIYKRFFDFGDRLQVQTGILTGWSDLFPDGPIWNRSIERRGVALVSMPVVLERARNGAEVLVPYPCIAVKNANSGDSASLFMEGVGTWISQSSSPATSDIEFVLPEEVGALNPTSIQVQWDIEAPRRQARLSLIHAQDAQPLELISLDAPSLPWQAVLENPVVLEAARGGKLVLRIEVSEDRVAGGMLPWRIRHLRLSIRGNVLSEHPWNGSPTKDLAIQPSAK